MHSGTTFSNICEIFSHSHSNTIKTVSTDWSDNVGLYLLFSGGAAHVYPREALPFGDVRQLHGPPGCVFGHHVWSDTRGTHDPVCGILPDRFPRGSKRCCGQEALQPHSGGELPLHMGRTAR